VRKWAEAPGNRSGAKSLAAIGFSRCYEADSKLEHKTQAAEAKKRKSKPRMLEIFDGLVLAPENISDAEVAEAFERFAETRGWHARI
jgi:hypothetical protein